jgi:hypothetical protein
MKQFLWGVAATVVGGFLLFFATNYYTDWVGRDSNKLTYQSNPSIAFVDKFALDAILSIASDEKNDGKIGAVSIKNETEKDIRNAKVLIAPTESDLRENNFHGFGLANSYGNDILNPIFEVKDEGIEVSCLYWSQVKVQFFGLPTNPHKALKFFH